MVDAKKPKPKISETKAAYGARRRSPSRKGSPKDDFVPLEELIKQQGTKPFRAADLEKWDFWPEGEDVEEFIMAATGGSWRKMVQDD